MRKKIQIAISVLLVIGTIAALIGIPVLQKDNKKDETQHQEEPQDTQDEWSLDHQIDWETYFEEGGFFGEYGDESASFPSREVNEIDIKAENATIHILHSEQTTEVEVYTQRGNEADCLSMQMEDGVLSIIEFNKEQEESSDGSYIEVLLPSGKKLSRLEITQKAGATSLSTNGEVKKVVISMNAGVFMADELMGQTLIMDANTANLQVQRGEFEYAQLCINEGTIRVDDLNIKKRLELLCVDGVQKVSLSQPEVVYRFEVSNESAVVEVNGEELNSDWKQPTDAIPIVINARDGKIKIETSEE